MVFDRTQQKDQPAREHEPAKPRPPAASTHAEQPELVEHDIRTLLALQALTDTALSQLSLEVLLPELLERVRAVMQVDDVAIALLDEQTGELEVRAALGPEEELVGTVRIPLGVGFAGRIAATRAPLAIDDLSTFPASTPRLPEGVRSALGVPLLAGGRVLGVVHVGSTTARQFSAADTALLERAADRIARAVERAQLFAEMEVARRVAEQQAAFLKTTLEALGDGIVITDASGRLRYGNPAYSALLGASESGEDGNGQELPADVSSRVPLLDVRDADGRPLAEYDMALSRVLRGETLAGPSAFEIQIRRLDGQEAYLSLTGAPVRDAAGQLLGAVLAVRDVTERRRLERQAHEATSAANERAARLEAIFSSVADGLFVYDADGRILERNPVASALLAAFTPAGSHDASVCERGRSLEGGLRDAGGRTLPDEQWPQRRIANGEMLAGSTAVDIRMRRVDGRDMFLSVSGAPLYDETGAIAGSVCLYRDITDRWELGETVQRRTNELEAANLRLRTLVDVLPVGVSIVDEAGRPVMINDAVRQIWGQDQVMSEGTEPHSAYRAWRTDTGQPVGHDEWGLMRALAYGEVSVGQEYDIEAFDGQRKTILDSAAPLRDDSGATIGAVSVIFDITERRQLELRSREALEAFIAITRSLVEAPDESAGAGLATEVDERSMFSDGDGAERPPEESPLARRLAELTRSILGCSRVAVSAVEEVDGQLYDRPVALVGMTPELEQKWWTEQLALQPHVLGTGLLPEDNHRLATGEVLTLDLTRPPYQVPNDYGVTALLTVAMRLHGRTVGLLALDFDDPGGQAHAFTPEEVQIAEAVARLGAVVLERDRLLSEREAARAEALALTEANRRMDEFLGIAGHELRTPLTTVKANLQLAERRARQALQADLRSDAEGHDVASSGDRGSIEQLLRLLHRATQSVDRQERLVQDLLDVSRISADHLEYRMAPHDLLALVCEAVEEQRLNAPRRLIELDLPERPVMVEADADRIGQVVTNYLTNALKYSATETPISVMLRIQGRSARVDVRDQGPGLSAVQQRHLFERFHRVPGIEVVSGSGVGLGLGLYISKTIVEQHGGRVGVESAAGEGATFWFTLPLATTHSSDDRVNARSGE